jgi:hypothetical protein
LGVFRNAFEHIEREEGHKRICGDLVGALENRVEGVRVSVSAVAIAELIFAGWLQLWWVMKFVDKAGELWLLSGMSGMSGTLSLACRVDLLSPICA